MDSALAEKSRADPLKSPAKIFACHLQNLEKNRCDFSSVARNDSQRSCFGLRENKYSS